MLESGLIDRDEAQNLIGRIWTKQMVPDWLKPPPPPFRLPLTYDPLPTMAELELIFGKDMVSNHYDGRVWERHPTCANIRVPPSGTRLFQEIWVALVPDRFVRRSVADCRDDLAERFRLLSYRFAVETELVEIAEYRPDLYRNDFLWALGSQVTDGQGSSYVPVLWPRGSLYRLSTHRTNGWLEDNHRLLLIREES